MLLRTHVATALSMYLVIDAWLASTNPGYSSNLVARLLMIFIVGFLQYFIDSIGHTWVKVGGRSFPARNKWHSLPGVLAISFAISMPLALVFGDYRIAIFPTASLLLHWLEDLVTEGGVYLGRKRIRLPFMISYDNAFVNRTAIAIMYLWALTTYPIFSGIYTFVVFTIITIYNVHAFLLS